MKKKSHFTFRNTRAGLCTYLKGFCQQPVVIKIDSEGCSFGTIAIALRRLSVFMNREC